MPIILANREAEIRRIAVQDQPWQIVHKILSKKFPTQKRTGEMPRRVENLTDKPETLSSNPSTAKKKSQGREMNIFTSENDISLITRRFLWYVSLYYY
jgi:hypothetical protein